MYELSFGPFLSLWNIELEVSSLYLDQVWYSKAIENSLTTLSQKDPVSEYNSQLWNSGVESDKDQMSCITNECKIDRGNPNPNMIYRRVLHSYSPLVLVA